ncbi:hypothetical protein L228DRAFT_250107 [Xylona heveae TC161]|uniref:Altered inheritance of mitochondria protein 11 n=1 Tax=Xylona heveae (strain CBS 132557 / TC161) TaxID=1328760 RepID=A0A165AG54_XYLHT|nr:hypothetical protein L228DRAFT_250107 [Xylona heveae TC161]KZF20421.1 hypothetical protein L228DRAFT_250107 [Xylona heveae TC161]
MGFSSITSWFSGSGSAAPPAESSSPPSPPPTIPAAATASTSSTVPATPTSNTTTPMTPTTPTTPPELLSPATRTRKQLSLFFGGATFFLISTLITRRSLAKRRLASAPSFYHPSNAAPQGKVNGAMDALEALNIATINVTSLGIMTVGGALYAFDICTLDEMRRKIRGGLGVDGTGRSAEQAEENIEEWIASVMARKEDKERKRAGDEGLVNERGKAR